MKQKDIIFGNHAVLDAMSAGKEISKIWIKNPTTHPSHKKIIELAKSKTIPVSKSPLVKLNRLTSQRHQGVIALLSPVNFADLATIVETTYEKGEVPLMVMLNRIEDTRNLGAIVRTAVATNVHAIILSTKETAPIDGVTMKTSAGTLGEIPICRVEDLAKAIEYLQASGIQVVACTEKATKEYYATDLRTPTALFFGGEAQGITTQYLLKSDEHIRIPMTKKVNSLNLSVATAVILYETVRQRSL